MKQFSISTLIVHGIHLACLSQVSERQHLSTAEKCRDGANREGGNVSLVTKKQNSQPPELSSALFCSLSL